MKTSKKIRHFFRIQFHLYRNYINIALYLFLMFSVYFFVKELLLKVMLMLIISTMYGKR